MHSSDRGIGERLTGKQGAKQHGLTRFAVLAVLYYVVQVASQQAQGFTREHIG